MKTFLLSLVLAALTEALLVTACLMFGGMGPCGLTNDLTGIVLMLHLPGILLGSALHLPGDLSAGIFDIGSVVLGLTMYYFVVFTAAKLFRPRAKNPVPGSPVSK